MQLFDEAFLFCVNVYIAAEIYSIWKRLPVAKSVVMANVTYVIRHIIRTL